MTDDNDRFDPAEFDRLAAESARIYTNAKLTHSEVLKLVDSSTITKLEVSDAKDLSPSSESSYIELVAPLKSSLDLLHEVQIKCGFSPNAINVLVGYEQEYGKQRLLVLAEEELMASNSNSKVTSTAVGGVAVGFLIVLISIFGFSMMGNIQTPQSFAKKDLMKGKINK